MSATSGSWKKGQSGNPGGRKKADVRIKELAAAYTPECLKELAKVIRQDGDMRAKVAAIMGMLAYAHGKPAQRLDISNNDGSLAGMFSAAVHAANGMTAEAEEQSGIDQPTH